MSGQLDSKPARIKPSWVGITALYLAFVAVVVRTLAIDDLRPILSLYLGLELVYIVLFTLVLWKYTLPGWLMHLYLVIQSSLVLWMLALHPRFDFVVLLFFMLTYPVSLAFSGRTRWVWIGILVLLTGGGLMYFLGGLRGLALSLTTIAAEIVIPAFMRANQQIEQARLKSQALLNELQATHQHLQDYAGQVEELAAVQERNRLARELHDTVSQLIFSISLTTRSAQVLLERDPSRAAQELERLQGMTAEALAQLRSLITQLRPQGNSE